MTNFLLLSSDKLRISPRQQMRRRPAKEPKISITMNLPERLRELSDEWATANEYSLSTLIEYLLRRHLEENGINPNMPPEAFIKMMGEKFGLTPEQMEELHSKHIPAPAQREVVGELPA
jgi:hypothetical protein